VHRAIPCALRKWRSSFLTAGTRAAWRAFKADLRSEAYDAVIDLQGLTKSALIARLATLAPGGKRYAMANRTEGSSYERATRWVADVAIPLEPHVHAVQRARLLCAAALGHEVPDLLEFGLGVHAGRPSAAIKKIAFVTGTSRADKLWPVLHWARLGQQFLADGYAVRLVHGSEAEELVCQDIGRRLGRGCERFPRLKLDALVDELAGCAGVIGVDSGVSHIAVALGLPHVQIYNFDTAWRTGPLSGPGSNPRQVSVFGQPAPTVDAIWQAWKAVGAERGA
jgi:heptosyltransferase-1